MRTSSLANLWPLRRRPLTAPSSPRPGRDAGRAASGLLLASGLLATAAATLLGAGTARAQSCASLPKPLVVAVDGSAAPYLEKLAQIVQRAETGDSQMTVIFQTVPSCTGIESMAFDTQVGSCAPGACIKGKAQFWTQDPSDRLTKQCDLDAKGTHVDMVLADVFPQTCPSLVGMPTPGLVDTVGPVSAYGFVMDKKAAETAIHAEEAHFVFGTGSTARVKPWTTDGRIVVLGEKSASQALLGRHVQLAANRWKGALAKDFDDAVTQMGGDLASGITVLPLTYAGAHRDLYKVLSFKALDQRIGAVYPDRRASTVDRQNVRDGHYPLWGYLHTVVRADPARPGQPLLARAGKLADFVLGRATAGGKDMLKMQVDAGFIPQCAMRVARATDAAPLTAFSPTDGCGCWFEKNAPGGDGVATCQECKAGATCGAGTCRRELCEVQ